MKITYLNHSGFLLEYANCGFLFDYYKGDIPNMDHLHSIFIFVSHWHEDHYNHEIFALHHKYENITYILDEKVKVPHDILLKMPSKPEQLLFVKADNNYELKDVNGHTLKITTLRSTDIGVAFLLKYQDKTIYHAGDLNLWVWQGESKAYNHNMKANFDLQMKKLDGVTIDVAFVPLDPRQEDDYAAGLLCLLQTASVSKVFPMHFWNKPEIITRFLREYGTQLNQTEIIQIQNNGDSFDLS